MDNIATNIDKLFSDSINWIGDYTDDFVLLICTIIILHLIFLVAVKLFKGFITKKIPDDSARAETYYKIIRDFIKYVLYVIYVLLFLQSLGVSLTVLVTSIGALSVIVGIASQELIMDMIKGVIILVDHYYSIGDYIKCAEYEGYVVDFKIRATVLKTFNNEIIIIPNSNIENITNYSKMDPFIFCNMPVSYDYNITDSEANLVPKLISKMNEYDIVNNIEYFGLSNLNESCYNLMFSINCDPEQRFIVQRQMNREFMIICNDLQLDVPYNKLVIKQD